MSYVKELINNLTKDMQQIQFTDVMKSFNKNNKGENITFNEIFNETELEIKNKIKNIMN